MVHCDFPMIPVDNYHPSLEFFCKIKSKLNNKQMTSNSNQYYYNFKKADFLNIYNHLNNQDWSILYECDDVNVALDRFYNKTSKSVQACPWNKLLNHLLTTDALTMPTISIMHCHFLAQKSA